MNLVNSKTPRTDLQKVFVYGTLKKGFENHERYLKNAKELGQAQVDGIMFHLGCFPAISLAEQYTKILGEVYQCTWEDILEMDKLEGVDTGFYSRVEIALYPYRKAWAYVFLSEQASRQKWIVPSGLWRGPQSPQVAWGGWGKGALIGAFETDRESSSIRVGQSNKQEFFLRKDNAHGTYNLVRIQTGEILGTYKNLGDMIKEDSRTILSLPSKPPITTTTAAEEIKKTIYQNASNYNPPGRQQVIEHLPVPFIGGSTARTPFPEPQVARLLGVKVREA